MPSSTKVAVIAKTAAHVVVDVVVLVVVVVLHVASMKRGEISNQCACCERTTFIFSKHKLRFSVGQHHRYSAERYPNASPICIVSPRNASPICKFSVLIRLI